VIFDHKNTAVIITLFLLSCSLARAQHSGNLSLSGQLVQPVGAYAAIQGDMAGFAGPGPGACIEIDLPVFPVFNWMSTIAVFATPYSGNNYDGVRPVRLADHYYYKGIDVLTGLRMSWDVGDGGELFAFAQIGMRRMSVPGFEGVARDVGWKKELVRYQFSAVSNSGGGIGIGLLINKKYAIILRYLNFGSYDFGGLMERNDTGIWEEEVDRFRTSSATVSISFGVNFRDEG